MDIVVDHTHSNVRDIHDELEVTVCKSIKTEPFLGKISLPLHRVSVHVCVCVCVYMYA